MTSAEDTPPQTICPECQGDNLYAHGGINARGGYGPDLLPGTSGVFSSAKMQTIVCRDCGLIRFYATRETLARITPDNGWWKTR
jgi:rubredoxin